jgi:hypothetical protein
MLKDLLPFSGCHSRSVSYIPRTCLANPSTHQKRTRVRHNAGAGCGTPSSSSCRSHIQRADDQLRPAAALRAAAAAASRGRGCHRNALRVPQLRQSSSAPNATTTTTTTAAGVLPPPTAGASTVRAAPAARRPNDGAAVPHGAGVASTSLGQDVSLLLRPVPLCEM